MVFHILNNLSISKRLKNGVYRRKWLLRRYFRGQLSLLRANMQPNGICAWYDDSSNFGDQLTPDLLNWLGLYCIHNPSSSAHIMGIGSIIGRVTSSYSGTIMGSGFLYDGPNISMPAANFLAVRGELTRQRLGCDKNVLLGDPGLLFSEIFKDEIEQVAKSFIVGIVPHYSDANDQRIQEVACHNQGELLIIDVRKKPREVIRDIASCQHILSSSLHGLVFADSLGIPSCWLGLSDGVADHGYKFHDYYSALKVERRPKVVQGSENIRDLINMTSLMPSDNIAAVCEPLQRCFSDFADEWRGKKFDILKYVSS